MPSLQIQLENHLKQLEKTPAFLEGAIDLSQQQLKAEHVLPIQQWLHEKTPRLLFSLNLSNNRLGMQEPVYASFACELWRESGIMGSPSLPRMAPSLIKGDHPLAQLFLQLNSWKIIDISRNGFIFSESHCILQALTTHKRLSQLIFDHNLVGDQGIKILINLLQDCPHLKRLSLAGCQLNDRHVEDLALHLKNHQGLRELDLRFNPLTDKAGLALNALLKTNKRIIRIQLNEDGITDENIKNNLQQKLTANQQRQKELHDSLLDSKSRFQLAKNTIVNSEDYNGQSLLSVLIGLGLNLEDQEAYLAQEEQEYSIIKRKIAFKSDVITEQLIQLQAFRNQDLRDVATRKLMQQHFDQLLQDRKELTIALFKEEFERQEEHKKLDGKNIEGDTKELFLRSFSEHLEPSVPELAINFSEDTNFDALEQQLEQVQAEANIAALTAQKHINELTMIVDDCRRDRARLEKRLENLYCNDALPAEYLAEYDDIKNRLIKANLDLAMKDEAGHTLLSSAFTADNPSCVRLLLKKGADLLQRDDDGLSVLERVMREGDRGVCHQAIIAHIKREITEVWSNPLQECLVQETLNLSDIKRQIDNYLDIIFTKKALLIFDIFHLGDVFYADTRKNNCIQYYNFVRQANEHKDDPKTKKPALLTILGEMIDYAQKTKRNFFDRSILTENVLKVAQQFWTELRTHWPAYLDRLQAARSAREYAFRSGNHESNEKMAMLEKGKQDAEQKAENRRLEAEEERKNAGKERKNAETERKRADEAEERAKKAELENEILKAQEQLQKQQGLNPHEPFFNVDKKIKQCASISYKKETEILANDTSVGSNRLLRWLNQSSRSSMDSDSAIPMQTEMVRISTRQFLGNT